MWLDELFLVIGSQAGVPQKGMLTMNLTYNYVNQGDLLDGTTGIIPEVDTKNRRLIPNHHLETRTINQVYTLDLNYGVTDRFALATDYPLHRPLASALSLPRRTADRAISFHR